MVSCLIDEKTGFIINSCRGVANGKELFEGSPFVESDGKILIKNSNFEVDAKKENLRVKVVFEYAFEDILQKCVQEKTAEYYSILGLYEEYYGYDDWNEEMFSFKYNDKQYNVFPERIPMDFDDKGNVDIDGDYWYSKYDFWES